MVNVAAPADEGRAETAPKLRQPSSPNIAVLIVKPRAGERGDEGDVLPLRIGDAIEVGEAHRWTLCDDSKNAPHPPAGEPSVGDDGVDERRQR